MGSLRAIVATVATVCVVAACGAGDDETITERAPSEDPSTLLPTVASDEEIVGPAPSSTVPVEVDPLFCTEEPITIAERILVARRQDAPSPGCTSIEPAELPAEVCWTTCGDGTAFVDFALDPELAVAAASGPETRVRYVAVYRTSGRLDRRAEALVLAGTGAADGSDPADEAPGSWTVSAVVPVDLTAETAAADEAARRYLAALASGDELAAAQLVLAAAPGPDGTRPDLARLVEEGLLPVEGVGPEELATALAGWCELAACRLPDDIRTEITAVHGVNVIATYDTDLGPFDVVLDAGTTGGRQFVRGLPPVLP